MSVRELSINIELDAIKSAAISPNNKYVIIGDADYAIRIYDLESKQLIHSFENAHSDWVMGLCISSDSRVVVSCSPDKALVKWDLFALKRLQILPDAHRGKPL